MADVRSVLVTGHARSGTSLTAGVLQAHGVFFGECGGPVNGNPTGRVEHVWLKRKLHRGSYPTKAEFLAQLEREGWEGGPWGVKFMPKWWPELFHAWGFDEVVTCFRNPKDIVDSARRMGWRDRSVDTVAERFNIMQRIRGAHRIDTALLAGGSGRELRKVVRNLGLTWDAAKMREVIVPGAFTNPKKDEGG